MEKYKKILKILLSVNIMFILVVAGLGYRNESRKRQIAEVSNTLLSSNTMKESKSKAVPVGQTVGIYINTKGIFVIDTGEVTGLDGRNAAPAKNRLMQGDYITALNGEKMKTKKQLVDYITNCDGEDLIFSVLRDNKEIEVRVVPVQTAVDEYKVGIWVKDDLQGLGTVTFVQGDSFGALGHSINDSDTGKLLKVSGGEIYEADIFGVAKGTSGYPGEIEGMIAYQTENVVGHIEQNKLYGIFGTVTDEFAQGIEQEEALEIAEIEKVKKGRAYIQSYVSGEKKQYEIKITNIHQNENGDSEMEIVVVDKELIDLTGGIVQGMSGSPIIQDGKLIGAVTHVFVEDPTRGYGIFVEEMLEQK